MSAQADSPASGGASGVANVLVPGAIECRPAAQPGRNVAWLHHLLEDVAQRGASDLLLIAGAEPVMLLNGRWMPLADDGVPAELLTACLNSLLSPEQRARLNTTRDLDFGHGLRGTGRYRINAHFQRGVPALAIRAIPTRIPRFETLGLPPQILSFADFPSGLVLITGRTGQGKSTTLASLIDHANRTSARHIITVEDPIEFWFANDRSYIEQRQIGDDTPDFASALRHVLRQRPDVILIGEMRDLETISTALTAAETGHLVLATLHTASAIQTLSRMIDVFPPNQQGYVRMQLAASLRAIVSQTLVPDAANQGLTPAAEILISTHAIQRAIRDNETHLIYSMVETGRRLGMNTLEQALAELVKAGRVMEEEALTQSIHPERMARLLGRKVEE